MAVPYLPNEIAELAFTMLKEDDYPDGGAERAQAWLCDVRQTNRLFDKFSRKHLFASQSLSTHVKTLHRDADMLSSERVASNIKRMALVLDIYEETTTSSEKTELNVYSWAREVSTQFSRVLKACAETSQLKRLSICMNRVPEWCSGQKDMFFAIVVRILSSFDFPSLRRLDLHNFWDDLAATFWKELSLQIGVSYEILTTNLSRIRKIAVQEQERHTKPGDLIQHGAVHPFHAFENWLGSMPICDLKLSWLFFGVHPLEGCPVDFHHAFSISQLETLEIQCVKTIHGGLGAVLKRNIRTLRWIHLYMCAFADMQNERQEHVFNACSELRPNASMWLNCLYYWSDENGCVPDEATLCSPFIADEFALIGLRGHLLAKRGDRCDGDFKLELESWDLCDKQEH